MSQKIRFCEKKVGNFITSKCSKNDAFQNFSKKNFLRISFWIKKPSLKGFFEIMKRIDFLTIFVNLWKRLESAVLEGHRKFSIESIIWTLASTINSMIKLMYILWIVCFLTLGKHFTLFRCRERHFWGQEMIKKMRFYLLNFWCFVQHKCKINNFFWNKSFLLISPSYTWIKWTCNLTPPPPPKKKGLFGGGYVFLS